MSGPGGRIPGACAGVCCHTLHFTSFLISAPVSGGRLLQGLVPGPLLIPCFLPNDLFQAPGLNFHLYSKSVLLLNL